MVGIARCGMATKPAACSRPAGRVFIGECPDRAPGPRARPVRARNVDGEAFAVFDLAGRLFYCLPSASVTGGFRSRFTRLRVSAGGQPSAHGPASRRQCFRRWSEVAAGISHGVFLASPSLQTGAPLWLKVLVIVMGLLIVAVSSSLRRSRPAHV